MILFNKLNHLRGKTVNCNGHRYEIDSDGFAHITDKADAKKLLSMNEWSAPAKAKKAPQEAPVSPPKPEPPKEPSQAPEPAVEAVSPGSEEAEAGETTALDDPGLEAGDEEVPEENPEPAAEPEEDPELDEGPSPASDDSVEWPDPTEAMKKDYLQEMAQAYEVEGWAALTKKQLVAAIMEKMYE